MKAIRLFSMAALAIMMAACSSDLNEITEQPQQPQQAEGITFKAILPAPGSDATRTALSKSGASITVAWKQKEDGVYEGDKIALLHNGVKDVATVTAVDGSGNATIEATITGSPANNDDVVLVYPAASVNSTGSGTGFEPDATYAAKQLTQNGSLVYIGNYLDGREGSGKLSVSAGNASLKENVTMTSKIAIWNIALFDTSLAPVNATKVTMKLGNQIIAQATLSGSTNELDMCVVPKSLQTLYAAATAASLPTPVFCIEATVGTTTYTYPVFTPLNLSTGTFYQSAVNMGTLGDVMGSDGKFYADGDKATAALATPIGVLAYIGDDATTEPTFGCGHGLVLCLKNAASGTVYWSTEDVSKFPGEEVANTADLIRTENVSGYTYTATLTVDAATADKYPAAKAAKNYTGLTAPTGSMGWFLPSAQQWVKMQEGLGGLSESAIHFGGSWFDNSHTAVNNWDDAMAKAGSGNFDSMKTPMLYYWSSSEFGTSTAVQLAIKANGMTTSHGFYWLSNAKNYSGSCVRPILAF